MIVISGPTAVGKSAIALQLAKRLQCALVSADSRQIYRGMDIGTAKPSLEDQQVVPHYFIDILDPRERYTAGRFEREALALCEELIKKDRMVVVCGGTGLYLKALTEGLDQFPDIDKKVIDNLEKEADSEDGLNDLKEELKASDPEYFESMDTENPRRLVRALSVIRQSGRPFSSFQTGNQKKRSFGVDFFVLERPRNVLYERINRRVDDMMNAGFLKEAKVLSQKYPLDSIDTVGYSELLDHLDGRISLEEAVEKIKQHTRNYAKRQITWFKKVKNAEWLSFEEEDQVIETILARIS